MSLEMNSTNNFAWLEDLQSQLGSANYINYRNQSRNYNTSCFCVHGGVHCLESEVFMTDTATTRDFRGNLKHYFDIAKDNPVTINRGQDRYFLLHESEFLKMKEEISNLQKSLISTLQSMNEEDSSEIFDVQKHHDDLIEEFVEGEPTSASDKFKKAAG